MSKQYFKNLVKKKLMHLASFFNETIGTLMYTTQKVCCGCNDMHFLTTRYNDACIESSKVLKMLDI